MQRRNFIQLGLTGAVAGFFLPELALAKNNQTDMAGGVFYTKQNPGRWHKKVAGHLPKIKIVQKYKKLTVQVVTAHGMEGFKHYIVKHVLLDQNFNFLAENMFNPKQDKIPASTFTLDNYTGLLYVLSMCNKHDVWLNSAKI